MSDRIDGTEISTTITMRRPIAVRGPHSFLYGGDLIYHDTPTRALAERDHRHVRNERSVTFVSACIAPMARVLTSKRGAMCQFSVPKGVSGRGMAARITESRERMERVVIEK